MHERILFVVDDEPDLLDALALGLAKNFTVRTFAEGQAALDALADADVYAFACDLNLRGSHSGQAVYEALRDRRWPVRERFLFITGGSLSDEVDAFLKESPVPVLEKPFSAETLVEALERVRKDAGASTASGDT